MEYCATVTDETLREMAVHGSSEYPFAYYPEDIWQFDFHRVDWHWHHELEFMYLARGSVLCLAGEDRIELRQGSGIFINSGVLHRYEAQESAVAPNIVFSPSLLAAEETFVCRKYVMPVIRSSVPYQLLDPHIDWQAQILQILRRIFALQEAGEDCELTTVRMLLEMWELLAGHMDLEAGSSRLRRLNHKQAKLQIMMQFIHDHYMEEITLEQIAASASLSKSGALHIFRSGIQISPVAYLIRYRLAQAAEQLQTTRKSVSSVAADTGFADAGYFCRKFRQQYHMSAGEYRQKSGKTIAISDC
ncbi:AraC family transcriptional regulator [Mordavella massiliensis]|uniref:AraC family transcriptional regulator n=1 Tax=Mordavella massiliensis TaxID=1871024 RepID=A0A938XBE5_9CLOT|nr:helix-turn-helix domain-containing protein [Mordavella massiliensis]MBM6947967.1 AraC family transcriptional regulator [Mordavella massiliensis]